MSRFLLEATRFNFTGENASDQRLPEKEHMIGGLSLCFILTFSCPLLLVAGACALAVWAARQRDPQSKLIERLIEK